MTFANCLNRSGETNCLVTGWLTASGIEACVWVKSWRFWLPSTNLLTAIFLAYYNKTVRGNWQGEFPGLVSYSRFVEWMPDALLPLCAYLSQQFGEWTGISFLDSTSLKVCHNRRIHQHKVFEIYAKRGKTSVDWFYGFKLHLVVNERALVAQFHLDTREHRWPSTRAAIAATINR